MASVTDSVKEIYGRIINVMAPYATWDKNDDRYYLWHMSKYLLVEPGRLLIVILMSTPEEMGEEFLRPFADMDVPQQTREYVKFLFRDLKEITVP